jgi:hypothetical protein
MNPSPTQNPASGQLTDDQRITFRNLAAVLIPATATMPSAAEVGLHGTVIDNLLDHRPDLRERFLRGLDACRGQDPNLAARSLNDQDPTALAAIGLLASAAYYMDAKVRDLIGYPGQSARPFDVQATPAYISNGQLQRVIDRGPIFRPTPSPGT